MSPTTAYDKIIEILQECAREKGISEEVVKKIYDLEKGQTHLPSRTNEVDLRKDLLDEVRERDGEDKGDDGEDKGDDGEDKGDDGEDKGDGGE